ncbi:MAG: 2-aminobenzoate-CoA ligase [Spongiibacteraceae bacterium]|nr:2-aminobenzoate-CoA ligase [Spongiibacteraceae bacterium]
MKKTSTLVDTFARDSLPVAELQPDFIFELPGLQFAERINCATELLDKNVENGLGEKTALIGSDGSWTYSQLMSASNQIAHVLVEDMGLVPGNRVLLRAPNNPMLVACWFAVLKAGGIAVATMPMMRSRDLVPVIEKAEITLALCEDELKGELVEAASAADTLSHVLFFNGHSGPDAVEVLMKEKSTAFNNIDTASDDVALIAFTSGTTGVPKGVLHFHRDVLAMAVCFSEGVLATQADDIFIGSPPLAFTFGLGALVVFPMYSGATAVLLEKAGPEPLAKAIERTGATVCFTSPTGYRGILEQIDHCDIGSLRKCVSAGEHLQVPTFEAWQAATGLRLIDGIGSTEMIHIFISAIGDEIRPGSTGKAIPGYQACVLGSDDKPLPPGQSGRLAVKGPTGCRYLADERQKKYVVDGWNVTGDIYHMDSDGYFWFEGRGDDMIVSAGYNISAAEIEDVLMDHPAVVECAVVAAPDSKRGHIPNAFVVLTADHSATPELEQTLKDFVKAQIAPYKYPRRITFINVLPKTDTGKVQRFRLREISAADFGRVG